MLGWREAWWFRLTALVVLIVLSGGVIRGLLGLFFESADADRGTEVIVAALLFGFGVRFAMRRFRVERKPERHLWVVRHHEEPEPEELPEDPTQE